MKTRYFGEIQVADGALALMDGGMHGVQGHRLIIEPDGEARWERRTDSFQPVGEPGAGHVRLAEGELAALAHWRRALWELAEELRAYFPPIEQGPPRWVWAVLLRRGDEVRILEGGGMSPDAAPEPARAPLAWLIDRVDALSRVSP